MHKNVLVVCSMHTLRTRVKCVGVVPTCVRVRIITEIAQAPFDTEEDARIAGQIVFKMLRKRVLGGHKKQRTSIAGWFPSHKEGQVKRLLDKMVCDPAIPVEAYGGGHRSNVRLSSFDAAIESAEQRGADTEWISNPHGDSQ